MIKYRRVTTYQLCQFVWREINIIINIHYDGLLIICSEHVDVLQNPSPVMSTVMSHLCLCRLWRYWRRRAKQIVAAPAASFTNGRTSNAAILHWDVSPRQDHKAAHSNHIFHSRRFHINLSPFPQTGEYIKRANPGRQREAGEDGRIVSAACERLTLWKESNAAAASCCPPISANYKWNLCMCASLELLLVCYIRGY